MTWPEKLNSPRRQASSFHAPLAPRSGTQLRLLCARCLRLSAPLGCNLRLHSHCVVELPLRGPVVWPRSCLADAVSSVIAPTVTIVIASLRLPWL